MSAQRTAQRAPQRASRRASQRFARNAFGSAALSALLLPLIGAGAIAGAVDAPQIARAAGGPWVAQLAPAPVRLRAPPDAATSPEAGPVRATPAPLAGSGDNMVAFDLATLAPSSGLILPTVRDGLLADGP